MANGGGAGGGCEPRQWPEENAKMVLNSGESYLSSIKF